MAIARSANSASGKDLDAFLTAIGLVSVPCRFGPAVHESVRAHSRHAQCADEHLLLDFRDTSRPVPVYEVEVDGARIRYVSLLAKLSPARRKSELAKFAAEIKALAKKEAK
jgi:hypothetical protein